MAVAESVLGGLVVVVVGFVVAELIVTQIREYRFFKARNWDFSRDSGLGTIAFWRLRGFHWCRNPRARFAGRPVATALLIVLWLFCLYSFVSGLSVS